MPPFFALASQVYTPAPHMLELKWAPLVGALVVTMLAGTVFDVVDGGRSALAESVHLTERGGKLLRDIEEEYQKEIRSIMDVLGTEEIEQLVGMLEKIRANLKRKTSAGSG